MGRFIFVNEQGNLVSPPTLSRASAVVHCAGQRHKCTADSGSLTTSWVLVKSQLLNSLVFVAGFQVKPQRNEAPLMPPENVWLSHQYCWSDPKFHQATKQKKLSYQLAKSKYQLAMLGFIAYPPRFATSSQLQDLFVYLIGTRAGGLGVSWRHGMCPMVRSVGLDTHNNIGVSLCLENDY